MAGAAFGEPQVSWQVQHLVRLAPFFMGGAALGELLVPCVVTSVALVEHIVPCVLAKAGKIW